MKINQFFPILFLSTVVINTTAKPIEDLCLKEIKNTTNSSLWEIKINASRLENKSLLKFYTA